MHIAEITIKCTNIFITLHKSKSIRINSDKDEATAKAESPSCRQITGWIKCNKIMQWQSRNYCGVTDWKKKKKMCTSLCAQWFIFNKGAISLYPCASKPKWFSKIQEHRFLFETNQPLECDSFNKWARMCMWFYQNATKRREIWFADWIEILKYDQWTDTHQTTIVNWYRKKDPFLFNSGGVKHIHDGILRYNWSWRWCPYFC